MSISNICIHKKIGEKMNQVENDLRHRLQVAECELQKLRLYRQKTSDAKRKILLAKARALKPCEGCKALRKRINQIMNEMHAEEKRKSDEWWKKESWR